MVTFSKLRNNFPDLLRSTAGRCNLFVETFGTAVFFSPVHSKHLLAKKEYPLKYVSEYPFAETYCISHNVAGS
jgi:hypothetical protein